MFIHLVVNRLKILIRDKELIFWTLLFPLVLAILFNMAFSKITSSENFEPISIAIIDNETYQKDEFFKQTISSISEGENRPFDLQLIKQEQEAKEKLLKDEIKGYIINGKIIVKEQGIDQTILKSFLDQYYQKYSEIETMLSLNGNQLNPEVIQQLVQQKDYIQKESYSKENPDSTVNYFYSLLAMACLYGGFWGVKEIYDIQANQSSRAVRINLVPIHKMKIVICNLFATLIINFSSLLLLLFFMMFGLKIDFGNQIGFVMLSCLMGSLVGISLGMMIGILCKKRESIKVGILISTTMIFSFLSGMMYIDIKYLVNSNIPILGYLNPCNLLTDAFYSLYYYDTLSRYTTNMIILAFMAILFIMISYIVLRRQKYESI